MKFKLYLIFLKLELALVNQEFYSYKNFLFRISSIIRLNGRNCLEEVFDFFRIRRLITLNSRRIIIITTFVNDNILIIKLFLLKDQLTYY